jgi:hypothetical protein
MQHVLVTIRSIDNTRTAVGAQLGFPLKLVWDDLRPLLGRGVGGFREALDNAACIGDYSIH